MNTLTKISQPNIAKPRTIKQNKSLWKWFGDLAEVLNEAGLDQRVVLKPSIQIEWNKQAIHDHLWCPVQEAYIKEHSTTKLTTKDLNKIYEFLSRHLGEKFGVICDFPSVESNFLNETYGKIKPPSKVKRLD
jgi:hypothetical protein